MEKVQDYNYLEKERMKGDRRKIVRGSDRRRWPHMKPTDIPFLKKVEVDKGSNIKIVNLSREGLLLETETCLGPNLKIMIKLVTTKGVFLTEGTTLRSSVFSLKGAPKYRTAIILNRPFDFMDALHDAVKENLQDEAGEFENPINSGKIKGRKLQEVDSGNKNENLPAILTVVASDKKGVCLEESFELNDW